MGRGHLTQSRRASWRGEARPLTEQVRSTVDTDVFGGVDGTFPRPLDSAALAFFLIPELSKFISNL